MTVTLSRAKLDARYRVKGKLVLKTALHLGGGRIPAKGTDSPVVRDGYGRPFIPGSSLKGAVRSAVERIVPNLKISACGLFNSEASCLSALSETDQRLKSFRTALEAPGQPINGDLKQHISGLLEGSNKRLDNLPNSKEVTEDDLLFMLDDLLCDVCKVFGSPFISSAIFFHDAPVDDKQWAGLTQVRDGVGIDRDSGRAVDKIKYDYETVPPDTVFNFALTLESSDPLALGLAALALHELTEENVPLGGIRSRGLGHCQLDPDNTFVESLNMRDTAALQQYLSGNKLKSVAVRDFINEHISNLWTAKEGKHV